MTGDTAAVLLGGAALLVWLLHRAGTRRRQKRYRDSLRDRFSEKE